jgi:ketosteroid isomerase-like protein
MQYRRILLMLSVMGVVCTPFVAHGDEVADLKVALEHIVAAYGARDLGTLTASLHDDVTLFGVISPFPVDGKTAVRQYFERIFTSSERTAMELIDPHYRVVGTTGIVRGNVALTGKPKDGPATILFGRMTWTFVKVDDQWRVVAVHASRMPSGS